MADPFDLDAFIAEAEGEPFTFVFAGDTYTLPPAIDIRAIAEASIGNIEACLRTLMGADQWAQLVAADGVFDARALQGLLEAYARHSGLELPNSSGSTSSSPSTVERSKPTSNGRTTPRSPVSSPAT